MRVSAASAEKSFMVLDAVPSRACSYYGVYPAVCQPLLRRSKLVVAGVRQHPAVTNLEYQADARIVAARRGI